MLAGHPMDVQLVVDLGTPVRGGPGGLAYIVAVHMAQYSQDSSA